MNVETLKEEIKKLNINPMLAMSDCLRGFLIASPGKQLMACDFAAIEARVLAWLAGEEKVLDVFRGHGKIYEAAAADIYKVDLAEVTKEQRQIGKVAVLALGYQGGVGAFQSMAKNSNVIISDKDADSIKDAWRKANPNIVNFWYKLEDAAKDAILNQKERFAFKSSNASIKFKMRGDFLWCQLPSKRLLCYPYPRIEEMDMPWGDKKECMTYMSESSTSRSWIKSKAYGGLLAENVTQAVARDLLADAIVRLEDNGFPVVMHVHDEIVCEVETKKADLSEMKRLMTEVPLWAKGLPINADGWIGRRYRK